MAEQDSKPARILLVYDSSAMFNDITLVSSTGEYEVERIIDKDLDASLQKNSPGLIIIFFQSEKNGNDRIKKLREDPLTRSIPIITVSFAGPASGGLSLLDSGADLTLPVSASEEEITASIKALLRQSGYIQRLRQRVFEAQDKVQLIARANAEAAALIMEVEEKDRRIEAQKEELEGRARALARANAEAATLILEVEEKDRRLEEQAHELERNLDIIRLDLEMARDVQINLLPNEYPQDDTLRLVDRFIPATELCGDYYDYIIFDDGSFFVVIADVTGHGVAPALVGVQTRVLTRLIANRNTSPALILKELNGFMLRTFKRRFLMTMFVLKYDKDTKTLSYSGAGHCPIVRLSRESGALDAIKAQQVPLGIMGDVTFPEDFLKVVKGERYFLFTDGIIEVMNAEKTLFGLDRLKGIIADNKGVSGDELIERVLHEIRYFSGTRVFDDDITVIVMDAD